MADLLKPRRKEGESRENVWPREMRLGKRPSRRFACFCTFGQKVRRAGVLRLTTPDRANHTDLDFVGHFLEF